MKIIKEKNNTVKFKDVKAGETFTFGCTLYMKIRTDMYGRINTVCLEQKNSFCPYPAGLTDDIDVELTPVTIVTNNI